jgi:uncharacterized phage-like protein YoqJ
MLIALQDSDFEMSSKSATWKTKNWCEDNIKNNLKQVVCEDGKWILLKGELGY